MPLDSEPAISSHSAPEQPLADRLPPDIIVSDEQTPLLKRDSAVMANRTSAGIPTPINPSSSSLHNAVPAPNASESRRRRVPQAIAHRGFKAVAPENTMLAFRTAVEAGAHAIETDLHLSRDGVVVLSHDPMLKRCFGQDSRVRDHDWSYLSTLRTVREPPQPMPRLLDLLEYLNEPGLEDIWVMLDIKTDDDATELMRRIADTIVLVPARRAWHERLMICCWTTKYVKLSMEYLPEFPITNIGISTTYTRALARHVPNLSLSMLSFTLAMPILGRLFIRDMRRMGRSIYTWTVFEDERWMEWFVRQELDGVITDDPKLFLEICDRVSASDAGQKEVAGAGGKRKSKAPLSLAGIVRDLMLWIRYLGFVLTAMVIYFLRFGFPETQVRKMLGK
ncbi:PLC-like phosphodiesterase [Hypoxylon trugodes]|uniref:PLC-like phosphodiesterase n=1 Tax=Hypoxylon trugodes TaxID=326681 RepID=UPI002190D496|nr:PLC-like phosphodiesterase [Hypoxylon trugodes]KAI1389846.1 PLC-like phosphodiesterase [Hypoxylon trugodes]